jgi:hypothetical protein
LSGIIVSTLIALIAVLNLPTYLLLGWLTFGSWHEAGAAVVAGLETLRRRRNTLEYLHELRDENYEPPDYWLAAKLAWFLFSAAVLVAVQVKIASWLFGAE